MGHLSKPKRGEHACNTVYFLHIFRDLCQSASARYFEDLREFGGQGLLSTNFVGEMHGLEHGRGLTVGAASLVTSARDRGLGHNSERVAARLLYNVRLNFAVGELVTTLRAGHHPILPFSYPVLSLFSDRPLNHEAPGPPDLAI
jgi:hypothetical protein